MGFSRFWFLFALLAFGLLRAVCRRLGAGVSWVPALAAAWWAVHPIHHEVVTYVVVRTESMMAALTVAMSASLRAVPAGIGSCQSSSASGTSGPT